VSALRLEKSGLVAFLGVVQDAISATTPLKVEEKSRDTILVIGEKAI